MADLIGQSLGQYEIVGKLGSGGMATVYRARQVSVGRDVAIKVIESRLAENPEFLKRFEREARTIAALNHPHILKLFDFGRKGDLLYLVMELQPGGSVADLIDQGLSPLEQVSRLIEQIASALDYAHEQGIIHRDLKPQNVLLDSKSNAILTDFGIAKVLNETTALTVSGMAMGTPAYMSPEQCQGRTIDARSDLYSLGIMLFEMLTGQVPFKGDTPVSMIYMHLNKMPPPVRSLRPDLPLSVEKVINKALAKDPMQRFQSAGELAAAFNLALTDPMPVRRGSRSGLLIIGAIALVSVIGLLTVILSSSGQNANSTATPTISAQIAAAMTATQTVPSTTTLTPTIPTQKPQITLTPLPPSSTVTQIPTPTVIWTPTVPTATPSATYTSTHTIPTLTTTKESNPETLAAQTIVAKALQTAEVIASYTKTPTVTPTLTPSITGTNSLTPTITPSPTPTITQSATWTFTPTPMATWTPTWTLSPEPTVTLNATLYTYTPSLTLSPTVTRFFTPSSGIGTTRTDEHGIAQVYVPAGCFMMGSTDEQMSAAKRDFASRWGEKSAANAFAIEQPAHQVCITQGYWLDTYEVTNEAYQQFIKAGGYTTQSYWSEAGWQWKQNNGIYTPWNYNGFFDPQQPRVGVSWYEAEAYAKWRGGLLPTEAEWEYAARGPNSLIFPWGNTWDSSRANTYETKYRKTKPVGSYEDGKSWVGAYDMAGNADEWVADWYSDTYYQQQVKNDPTGPGSGTRRVQRGGCLSGDWVSVRATSRLMNQPNVQTWSFGFRVVTPIK